MNSNNFIHKELTMKESSIIKKCNTPEKVHNWLNNEIDYNHEPNGKTLQSFRRVVRSGCAYCLEGALTAAAILSYHGYAPKILCIESSREDHNIFIYNNGDGIRSVSKGDRLYGYDQTRTYKRTRDLVIAYRKDNPHFRGWTILDLRQFDGLDWITVEDDLWVIEKKLYTMKYHALFHKNGKRMYISPDEDGKKLIWV